MNKNWLEDFIVKKKCVFFIAPETLLKSGLFILIIIEKKNYFIIL